MARKRTFTHEHEVPELPTKRIAELVSKHSRSISLDAGCGVGAYLSSFNGMVVGLDISPGCLAAAKRRATQSTFLVRGDVRILPFRDKLFHFTLCSQVIEHLHAPDAQKAVSELERVTNGIVQVDTPNTNWMVENMRRLLYSEAIRDGITEDCSPHAHHSAWTQRGLASVGFQVRGCLGLYTRERIRPAFLADLYDRIVWRIRS